MDARTAHRIDRFRCQEQTTAITAPRLTPSRTTLMAPPPGKDSKTNSAKSSIEISPPSSIPTEYVEQLQPKARFIHVIESCSTVAIDTQTKYGTWAAATQR